MQQEFRTWRARLDEVHDGDTIRLVCDTGFDGSQREWMRLRRVFAPELKQRGGPTSRDFTVEWLATHTRPGVSWPFEVDTYRTKGDEDVVTFGRYIAEVRCVQDGASLNDAVIGFLATHSDWPKGIGA